MKIKNFKQYIYSFIYRLFNNPVEAKKNLDNIKKASFFINLLQHFTDKALGILTLFFLAVYFICQLLELVELKLKISHSALLTVELVARILAAISFILTCTYNFWKIKTDGFRQLWKALVAMNNVEPKLNFATTNTSNYHCRYVDTNKPFEDLLILTDLSNRGHWMSRTSISRRSLKFSKWLQADPHYVVLFENKHHQPIGYICVLGLDSSPGSGGDAHYKKDLEEFQINENMITRNPSTLILIQGMWLEPDFLQDALEPFLECFYKHVANFMHLEEKLAESTVCYVETISTYNTKFYQELGFVYLGKKSKSGNKILELDFSFYATDNDNSYNTKQKVKYFLQLRRDAIK